MFLAKKIRIILFVIFIPILCGILFEIFSGVTVFYYSPSDLKYDGRGSNFNKVIKIGGIVSKNSFKYLNDFSYITFIITDFKNEILVEYNGVLPDLFREGQGIIVQGFMDNNIFSAQKIFSKHDEKYIPPSALNK